MEKSRIKQIPNVPAFRSNYLMLVRVFVDKKRFRTSNFTLSEKKLLLRLAIQHREILENRMTNAATNVAKIRCWEEIASQFNANSGDIVRSFTILNYCRVILLG